MFSSLKLNSLKCQSNGRSDEKNEKCEDEDGDDVSDHMYEKLPNFESRTCQCHSDNTNTSSKSAKIPFSKRISKWRMECPGITNLRNSRVDEDEDSHYQQQQQQQWHSHQQKSKNNQEGGRREIPNLEHTFRNKVMTVNIEREDGNLGITLRGGFHQNLEMSRPVMITYIKPNSPAARLGTIKPGDRLLAVDGISLQGGTLNDAQRLLSQPTATTLLTIEYNVNVLESVENANGPLLVEIEKSSTQELGLTLFQSDDGVIIERIKLGSLADRSGVLHIGDEILAVNSMRICGISVPLESIMNLLENEYPILRLEILPYHAVTSCSSKYETWRTRDTVESISSGLSTFKGNRTVKAKDFRMEESEKATDYKFSHLNSNGVCTAEMTPSHTETLYTTLSRENGSFGLQFMDTADGGVLIHSVKPKGPAERSQCLHPGDRILSINNRSVRLENITANDMNDMLELKSDDTTCSKLNLHTEFDVQDTVVPSSGIFSVKLVKRGTAGLGLTMTASKSSGFVVCEMKKGSISHRAGSLVPGDRILAINNTPLDQCSVEFASRIFHQNSNIVTLKVQRENNNPEGRRCSRKITYTVDLQRYGGPLGITIAGSEEPSQPITISCLTPGGLAEQTGVIHIGDEILAINNQALIREPLSRAHALLQNSPDLVTLKLSRSLVPICSVPNNRSPVLPSSIDSAVESWDSSHVDLTSSPDPQKLGKDTLDGGNPNQSALQEWQPLDAHFPPKAENSSVTSATNNALVEDSDLAILDEITSENLKIKRELDLLSIKLDEKRKSMAQGEVNPKASIISNGTNFVANNSEETLDVSIKKKELNELKTLITEVEDVVYEEDERSDSDNVVKGLDKERESLGTTDFEKFDMAFLPETRNWCKNQYFGYEGAQGSIRSEFQLSQLYEVTLYKDPIYEDFGFSVSDGLYERGVFINRIRKGGPADLSNVLKPYDRILQVNKTYTQDFDCCLTVPLIASAGDSLLLLVARNPEVENSQNDLCFDFDKLQEMKVTTKLGPNNHEEICRIIV